MKRVVVSCWLLVAGVCLAGEFDRFIEDNGCGYAYIVVPTNLLTETIPAGVHPWGQVVTVDEGGVTNIVQKTIGEFVIFQRDNGDGTAVVKLSAKEGAFGRRKGVTVADLYLWNIYLTNYGLDSTHWLTLSEYRTAYPPEEME